MGGLSKPRLEALDGTLAGYVRRGELTGVVGLVSRGEDLHVYVGGNKSVGGEPVRRDSIFRISSMTKPITAVATMLLVEECKLRLDEPVDRLLPELAGRRVLSRLDAPLDDTVPAKRPITIRDLLTFRFGFGIPMVPSTYPIQSALDELKLGQGPPAPSVPPPPDEWMRRLGTLPLLYQPGERWMYNTGSDILGVAIARVSGQPLEAFLGERIFGPLGMEDTGFSVPAEKIERLVTTYSVDQRTGERVVYDPAAGGQWSRPPAFPSGAGGLVSTVDDYFAFARMLLYNGKFGDDRILSRPSVELMTRDHLTPDQKSVSGLVSGYFDNHGWGFGVSVVTRRDDYANVGSYGWDGGMGTYWANDPREGLVGVLMTTQTWNSPSPPSVRNDFWTAAYQSGAD